jgi:hypothetical protein
MTDCALVRDGIGSTAFDRMGDDADHFGNEARRDQRNRMAKASSCHCYFPDNHSIIPAHSPRYDTGRGGIWFLLGFVPLVGPLALFVLTCMPGERSENRYGSTQEQH